MEIPSWVDEYALDPGPGAYDGLPDKLRARLKKLIASLYGYWGAQSSYYGQFGAVNGALVSAQSFSKDWAFFALSHDYSSPAGLISAILPAAIAKVEHIFIVRLSDDDSPLPLALSAALELLGQEDIYSMPDEQAAEFLHHLSASNGEGTTVILGGAQASTALLKEIVQNNNFPYILPQNINIAVDEERLAQEEQAQAPDLDLLLWLHPEASIEPLAHMNTLAYDCLLTSSAACSCRLMPASLSSSANVRAFLVMVPGQEDFWIWPGLGPEAFYRKSFIVTKNI